MSKVKKTDEKVVKGHYLGIIDSAKMADEMFFKAEDLLKLENHDAVVNVACSHCKNIFEVTQTGAESICKYANIPLPESFEGKYFLASSCRNCEADKGNKIKTELKDVNKLIN